MAGVPSHPRRDALIDERDFNDIRVHRVFAKNNDYNSTKARFFPVGVPNSLKQPFSIMHSRLSKMGTPGVGRQRDRDILLLIAYGLDTHNMRGAWAEEIGKRFQNVKGFVSLTQRATPEEYYDLLMRAKFVLSPPGSGQDTMRTWESVLFGAVPIFLSSFLDPMYKDIPALIVDSFSDVTVSMLTSFRPESRSRKAVWGNFWLQQIADDKKACFAAYSASPERFKPETPKPMPQDTAFLQFQRKSGLVAVRPNAHKHHPYAQRNNGH
jgi:hypothetical protein